MVCTKVGSFNTCSITGPEPRYSDARCKALFYTALKMWKERQISDCAVFFELGISWVFQVNFMCCILDLDFGVFLICYNRLIKLNLIRQCSICEDFIVKLFT